MHRNPRSAGFQKAPRAPLPDRANLQRNRVIQRDLVYVIGIPKELATEENLGRYEYFGQYGDIKKIVVNTTSVHGSSYQRPTVSAYVTFVHEDDAWECLWALENFQMNGHQMKASFGTSKYCASFLSGQQCTKADCMYLHQEGAPGDSFSTEDIQTNSPKFVAMTRPRRPPDYDDYPFQESEPTFFPPRRVYEEDGDWEAVRGSDGPDVESDAEEEAGDEEGENELDVGFVPDPSVLGPDVASVPVRNRFLATLVSRCPLTAKPLVVAYATAISLDAQFSLSTPTIRSVLAMNK
jgi:hypothetical protein